MATLTSIPSGSFRGPLVALTDAEVRELARGVVTESMKAKAQHAVAAHPCFRQPHP